MLLLVALAYTRYRVKEIEKWKIEIGAVTFAELSIRTVMGNANFALARVRIAEKTIAGSKVAE